MSNNHLNNLNNTNNTNNTNMEQMMNRLDREAVFQFVNVYKNDERERIGSSLSHLYLIHRMMTNNQQPLNNMLRMIISIVWDPFEMNETEECCICAEVKCKQTFCQLNCSHVFCVNCIDSHLNTKNECPYCRNLITNIKTQTQTSECILNKEEMPFDW